MRAHAVRLVLTLLLAGCGGGGGGESSATVAAPVQAAPSVAVPVAADDEAGIMAFHARMLAVEVGLDADGEARVAAILERAWTAAQADIQGRVEALLPIDEEHVSEVLLARQRAADLEIAALLTPAQRARFEELGGRVGAADAVSAGGVR